MIIQELWIRFLAALITFCSCDVPQEHTNQKPPMTQEEKDLL